MVLVPMLMLTLSVVNLPVAAGRLPGSVRQGDEPTVLDPGEYPGNNLRALKSSGHWIDWSLAVISVLP